jgi:hypothetical protein
VKSRSKLEGLFDQWEKENRPKYGFPENQINALKELYSDTFTKDLIANGNSWLKMVPKDNFQGAIFPIPVKKAKKPRK